MVLDRTLNCVGGLRTCDQRKVQTRPVAVCPVFFGSGECRWNQIVLDRTFNLNNGSGDCLPNQVVLDRTLMSWLAGAMLSMKGAHPVDKVPDKTLNCPCRW